ncbi:MAG: sulfatase-like hydrolase/transferase [Muribaculaceae bacterium]|nr:sulfatase-like hydrolase/transferase [Muribaculaceae bacterium]
MKRFKKLSPAEWLTVIVPLFLIIPNIALCFTERMGLFPALTNVFLPWSVFCFLMSLWRRTGWMALIMLPFMIYSAFQIVLLYLYGESIIAVDMFLNVVTTNPTEVGELLGNLIVAIGVVVVLYVPPLVTAVVLIIRHSWLDRKFQKSYRKIALWAIALSMLPLGASFIFAGRYNPTRDLFPVNVICNMARAIKRTSDVAHYMETSRDFRYGAVTTRDDSVKEVYLLVIGETSRGENWQLLGYDRETNPELSKMDNLVVFSKAVTQSNTTHKSVPMLISSLTAENFDSIGHHKSMITAFKEAGYHTYLFSNQTRNRSYTEYFCNEADEKEYIKDSLGRFARDHSLLENLGAALADTVYNKKFIILHTYGSHFNYRDRYDQEYARFTPDDYADAGVNSRDKLLNAFDNTILYVDTFLAKAIEMLRNTGVATAMIYTSDHGEDIFDDDRKRFLHASPTPTFHQLYVPMIMWISPQYNSRFGHGVYENLVYNSGKIVSPSSTVFPTVMEIADIQTPYLNHKQSLASDGFTEAPLLYVTDLNEAVRIEDSGVRSIDMKLFSDKQIINP